MRPPKTIGSLDLRLTSRDLPASARAGLLPRKNVYFRIGRHGSRPGLYRTRAAEDFATALGVVAARQGVWPCRDRPPIRVGWWSLDLLVVAPRRLRTLDVLVPSCDSDACLAPVKDALIYAGLLDNDARIVSDRTWVAYQENAPEVRIRLAQIESPDVELARAWPGVAYFGIPCERRPAGFS